MSKQRVQVAVARLTCWLVARLVAGLAGIAAVTFLVLLPFAGVQTALEISGALVLGLVGVVGHLVIIGGVVSAPVALLYVGVRWRASSEDAGSGTGPAGGARLPPRRR